MSYLHSTFGLDSIILSVFKNVVVYNIARQMDVTRCFPACTTITIIIIIVDSYYVIGTYSDYPIPITNILNVVEKGL